MKAGIKWSPEDEMKTDPYYQHSALRTAHILLADLHNDSQSQQSLVWLAENTEA